MGYQYKKIITFQLIVRPENCKVTSRAELYKNYKLLVRNALVNAKIVFVVVIASDFFFFKKKARLGTKRRLVCML